MEKNSPRDKRYNEITDREKFFSEVMGKVDKVIIPERTFEESLKDAVKAIKMAKCNHVIINLRSLRYTCNLWSWFQF